MLIKFLRGSGTLNTREQLTFSGQIGLVPEIAGEDRVYMAGLPTHMGNMYGVPVVQNVVDADAARTALHGLSAAYPGELFSVENSSDGTLVLSWIPTWAVSGWIAQALGEALSSTKTGFHF